MIHELAIDGGKRSSDNEIVAIMTRYGVGALTNGDIRQTEHRTAVSQESGPTPAALDKRDRRVGQRQGQRNAGQTGAAAEIGDRAPLR